MVVGVLAGCLAFVVFLCLLFSEDVIGIIKALQGRD